jgi:putative PIN family toxin of toxin-antitoxin system
MRAVVDTNVLLSALLWGGTPHALLEHVRNGTVTLISSPALLAELARVIERPKFDLIFLRTHTSRPQTLAELRLLAEVIDPPPLAQPVCRDKDDDAVLALALAAQADIVISGDDDLLCLNAVEGIPILTPAQALHKVLDSL